MTIWTVRVKFNQPEHIYMLIFINYLWHCALSFTWVISLFHDASVPVWIWTVEIIFTTDWNNFCVSSEIPLRFLPPERLYSSAYLKELRHYPFMNFHICPSLFLYKALVLPLKCQRLTTAGIWKNNWMRPSLTGLKFQLTSYYVFMLLTERWCCATEKCYLQRLCCWERC